jgi:phenylpyruvate tautomerase PptA (4-oxalocrotonate tautomerase family)
MACGHDGADGGKEACDGQRHAGTTARPAHGTRGLSFRARNLSAPALTHRHQTAYVFIVVVEDRIVTVHRRVTDDRPREERDMPVAYIDIPAGVNDGAKKKIFTEIYEAIHEAWPIPDTRVLIREWPNEAVSQDGRIENVPMRPICTLAVPPGLEHDAKQRLVRQISNTIGEACGREVEEIRLPSGTKIYNNWVLTFFWELPLDKVALGDLIATENPLVLESLPPQ